MKPKCFKFLLQCLQEMRDGKMDGLFTADTLTP